MHALLCTKARSLAKLNILCQRQIINVKILRMAFCMRCFVIVWHCFSLFIGFCCVYKTHFESRRTKAVTATSISSVAAVERGATVWCDTKHWIIWCTALSTVLSIYNFLLKFLQWDCETNWERENLRHFRVNVTLSVIFKRVENLRFFRLAI